ncbi:MAG: DUF1854 domain-containing protein [Clostridia bacterium]|nr:DUF1854 domain-containing protein [Clostridia bacterium]
MIDNVGSATELFRLMPENCRLYLSEKGLLRVSIPQKEYEGRAFLALAFPFETKVEYIAVQNEAKEELGMIVSLSDFDSETGTLVEAELKKKYFAPKILRITKLQEKYGSTFWDCETDHGPLSFTVKDTHRSFLRAGEDRIFVVDHNGCRYEIESISGLDKKSHSKIELYL